MTDVTVSTFLFAWNDEIEHWFQAWDSVSDSSYMDIVKRTAAGKKVARTKDGQERWSVGRRRYNIGTRDTGYLFRIGKEQGIYGAFEIISTPYEDLSEGAGIWSTSGGRACSRQRID